MNEIRNKKEFRLAFQKLKRSKAWRGTIDERKQKFINCHMELNSIYGRDINLEFNGISEEYNNINGASALSGYYPSDNTIVLSCKLSVITFMQLWLRAIGVDPLDAITLSKEVFSEIFPVSARKLLNVDGLYVKADPNTNDPNNDPIGSGA